MITDEQLKGIAAQSLNLIKKEIQLHGSFGLFLAAWSASMDPQFHRMTISQMSTFGDLILVAKDTVEALRACRHDDNAAELALADVLEAAIRNALEDRGNEVAAVTAQLQDLDGTLKEILFRLAGPPASSESL